MTNHEFTTSNSGESILNCFNLDTDGSINIFNLYERTEYKKGQNILTEGNKPLGLFYILSGKVKISKHGVDNKEQIIRLLGKGDFLGYKDLLIDSRYSVSANAFETTELSFIPKEDFMAVMRKDNKVARYFNELLCWDLMYTEQRLLDMVQKPVRERVAEALLELKKNGKETSNRDTGILMTRNDLANLVGSVKETVIRILSDFKNEHLISTNGSKIDILNPSGLHKITHIYH